MPHEDIHHKKKMLTLKPTNVTQGPAPGLSADIEGIQKTKKLVDVTSTSAKLDKSLTDSETDSCLAHNHCQRAHQSSEDGPIVLHPGNSCSCAGLDYHNYRLDNKLLKYEDCVAKSVNEWESDYKYK